MPLPYEIKQIQQMEHLMRQRRARQNRDLALVIIFILAMFALATTFVVLYVAG